MNKLVLLAVLAGLAAGAAPAHASVSDGTSNTIQVAERLSYTFENIMVESVLAPPSRKP